MYGTYVVAVVRRAFQPTARFTDVLQILAASAAPAIARFFGVVVPTTGETLAYIGAAAVAFIALRLFFAAPYQVWHEQLSQIDAMRDELAKPAHIENHILAKIRAKKKIRLAAILRQMYWYSCNNTDEQRDASAEKMTVLVSRAISLMGQAGLGVAFGQAFALLNSYCLQHLIHNDKAAQNTTHQLINDMLELLHGRITGEALAFRLPPGIEVETRP